MGVGQLKISGVYVGLDQNIVTMNRNNPLGFDTLLPSLCAERGVWMLL